MSELSRPLLRSDLKTALLAVSTLRTRQSTSSNWLADPSLVDDRVLLERIERTMRDAYDTLVADELAALAQAEAQ